MPVARPLPRKFLTGLEEAQADLRLLAQRASLALAEIQVQDRQLPQSRAILREIQITAYRVALELSQLKVAGNCDECPVAPPTTAPQAHLLVLADELERQARLARLCAQGSSKETPQVVSPSGNGHQT